MNHIHFLIPVESSSIEQLEQVNVASIRLRACPAIKTMLSKGWKVTIGDLILGNPKKIVVTKIFINQAQDRHKMWLRQIRHHKLLGAEIYLDYTDHHLSADSTVSKFYSECLQYVDTAIVPSRKMRELLFNFFTGPIIVIEDPIEFFNQPIKLTNKPITILWFGHASNINYLISFLKTGFKEGDEFNLIILSNKPGLDIFTNASKTSCAKIQFQTGLWSPQNMLYAATKADACIIPSNPIDPRKNGASSNRLITSFALGLPVAADNLESYIEFNDFYVDIRSAEFRNFFKDPSNFHEKTKLAQKIITPRFTIEQSKFLWSRALIQQEKI